MTQYFRAICFPLVKGLTDMAKQITSSVNGQAMLLVKSFYCLAPDFFLIQSPCSSATSIRVFRAKFCISSSLSYTISSNPNLQMVVSMLEKAFRRYPQPCGLILHSDQGWHYQHGQYQKILKDHNVTQSMSRKGNCLDNAMMENFFGLMKNELLYANKSESIKDFERALRKYIDWYNNKRIKLRLKGMSPAQYRAHFYQELNN